jgi:Transglycosylase-like domain
MPVRALLRRTDLSRAVATRLATAVATLVVLPLAGVAAGAGVAQASGTRWDCLAHYESSNRWHINTGNGHYGGLQFTLSTWKYYGGPNYSGNTYPNKATRAEQIVIGRRTAWKGWKQHKPQGGANAWPNTWGKCF